MQSRCVDESAQAVRPPWLQFLTENVPKAEGMGSNDEASTASVLGLPPTEISVEAPATQIFISMSLGGSELSFRPPREGASFRSIATTIAFAEEPVSATDNSAWRSARWPSDESVPGLLVLGPVFRVASRSVPRQAPGFSVDRWSRLPSDRADLGTNSVYVNVGSGGISLTYLSHSLRDLARAAARWGTGALDADSVLRWAVAAHPPGLDAVKTTLRPGQACILPSENVFHLFESEGGEAELAVAVGYFVLNDVHKGAM